MEDERVPAPEWAGNASANAELTKEYLKQLPAIVRQQKYSVMDLASQARIHITAIFEHPATDRPKTHLSHIRATRIYLDEIERRLNRAIERSNQ